MADNEDVLEMVLGWCAPDSVSPEFLDSLRAALRSMRASSDKLAETRVAFTAIGDLLKDKKGSEQALRELGRALETISVAQAVLLKGLPDKAI